MLANHSSHQFRVLRHSYLPVDCLPLRPDGMVAPEQFLGHLLIRQSPTEHERHITLCRRKNHAICRILSFILNQSGITARMACSNNGLRLWPSS